MLKHNLGNIECLEHIMGLLLNIPKPDPLMTSPQAKSSVPTIYYEKRAHSGINEGINTDCRQLSHLYLALLTQAQNKGAVGQGIEKKGVILSVCPRVCSDRRVTLEQQINRGFSFYLKIESITDTNVSHDEKCTIATFKCKNVKKSRILKS